MEPPGRTFGAPGLRAIEGCGGSDQAFEPFLLVILKMEKFPPRECFRDPGAADNVSVEVSLKVLQGVQAELLNLRPRLEVVDPTLVRFPHWIFGPLDLAQWLAFVGIHEERHLDQIQAIIASEEFKSPP